MKKTIQILLVTILSLILILIIVFIFNPLNSRNKLIGSILNSYLSSSIEGYAPTKSSNTSSNTVNSTDKHPLLNDSQEKTLENLGVNVSQLPTEITSGMQTCFSEKLGESRAQELISGTAPSAMDIIKARECIGK